MPFILPNILDNATLCIKNNTEPPEYINKSHYGVKINKLVLDNNKYVLTGYYNDIKLGEFNTGRIIDSGETLYFYDCNGSIENNDFDYWSISNNNSMYLEFKFNQVKCFKISSSTNIDNIYIFDINLCLFIEVKINGLCNQNISLKNKSFSELVEIYKYRDSYSNKTMLLDDILKLDFSNLPKKKTKRHWTKKIFDLF